MSAIAELVYHVGVVVGSTTLVSVGILYHLFPGAFTRHAKSTSDASFWAKVCTNVASESPFARSTGVYDLLVVDEVTSEGILTARVRLNTPLQNTMQSLHGGAAALLVDELTTAAIMSQRAAPGVSISMSLQYVNGCKAGTIIHVKAKCTRVGRIICHTDTEITMPDGTLLVKASHVKFCTPPTAFMPLLWMRTSVARVIVPFFVASSSGGGSDGEPLGLAQADGVGLRAPLTDPEKQAYYVALGTPEHELLGFDRAVAPSGLKALDCVKGGEGGECFEVAYELTDPRASHNHSGSLHGACTAMLVDILGSAAIARHPQNSGRTCGVATNLEVTYGAPGKGPVRFACKVLKLGGRLATVVVEAADIKGRLVARGTLTKYGKFRG